MRQTVFFSKTFYILLLTYIGVLIAFSLYNTVMGNNIMGLRPVVVLGTLFVFILTKSRHAKILISIWAGITIFIAVCQLIGSLTSNMSDFPIDSIIGYTLMLIVGILIVDFNRRTVKVAWPNQEL